MDGGLERIDLMEPQDLARLNGGLVAFVQRAYELAWERCRVAPDADLYSALGNGTLERLRAGEDVQFALDRGQRFGISASGGTLVPYVLAARPSPEEAYDRQLRAPHYGPDDGG